MMTLGQKSVLGPKREIYQDLVPPGYPLEDKSLMRCLVHSFEFQENVISITCLSRIY